MLTKARFLLSAVLITIPIGAGLLAFAQDDRKLDADEIAAAALFVVQERRARDPILDQVCVRILADEAQHVAFHLARLRDIQAGLLPAERAAWSLQFQILFSTALSVAWIDHRDALGAIGARRSEFLNTARAECIGFLDALAASHTRGPASEASSLPAFLRS